MSKVHIIVPEAAHGELYELTKYLAKKFDLDGGDGLGGENGYGVEFENDTFMMHPFCWCEEEACKWCGEENAPNFEYKPTGGKIWWYKWIGRSEKVEGEFDSDWLAKCIESTKKQPKPEQVRGE